MEKLLYILNIIADKMGKLILLASIVGTCYFSMKAFGAKDPTSGLVYLLGCTLPLALLSGALFVKICLPGIAEKITYGFFGGKSYLSKAPLILSPLWGDLKNGNFLETIEKAELLLENAPFHGELLYIYCSAAFSLPEKKEEGLLQLEKFFFTEHPRDSWSMKLLLLYMDNVASCRNREEILELLRRELKKSCYSKQDKETITMRMEFFGKDGYHG